MYCRNPIKSHDIYKPKKIYETISNENIPNILKKKPYIPITLLPITNQSKAKSKANKSQKYIKGGYYNTHGSRSHKKKRLSKTHDAPT